MITPIRYTYPKSLSMTDCEPESDSQGRDGNNCMFLEYFWTYDPKEEEKRSAIFIISSKNEALDPPLDWASLWSDIQSYSSTLQFSLVANKSFFKSQLKPSQTYILDYGFPNKPSNFTPPPQPELVAQMSIFPRLLPTDEASLCDLISNK